MKIFEKKDFLIFLKKISDILNKTGIKHEIPYCLINKRKFNYIDIIVYKKDIDQKILSRILNIEKFKIEDENIIITYIEDFKINWILSDDDKDFYFKFYYYSFNFFPYILKFFYSKLNLSYTDTGLKYIKDTKDILISNNLKNILDFINIDINMIFSNIIPSEDNLIKVLLNTDILNINKISVDDFKKLDNNFEYNKHYYIYFIKLMNAYYDEKISLNNLDFWIYSIETYFGIKNFSKYYIISELGYSNVKISNKEDDKSVIDDIEEKKNNNFSEYIKSKANSIFDKIKNRKKIKIESVKNLENSQSKGNKKKFFEEKNDTIYLDENNNILNFKNKKPSK